MSKKSYKRNQNRLYREIKRRIIAEQAAMMPAPVIEVKRNIKTLAVRSLVPNYMIREIEFVKTDMANKLTSKLVSEGFIEFTSRNDHCEAIADSTEMEARIHVVKPWTEGWVKQDA